MKDSLGIAQCAANILSVLRYYDLPNLVVRETLSDRVIFYRSEDFLWCFNKTNRYGMVANQKFEFYNFVHNHGQTAECGWRERVPMYSLQIVQHQRSIEIDLDVFNPNYGLGLMVTHLGEVFRNYLFRRKTDPFMICKGLQKRGIPVVNFRTGGVT